MEGSTIFFVLLMITLLLVVGVFVFYAYIWYKMHVEND
jgi:hypothetical protein